MAERKPISKKTRFEVFKRDRFTCQYCGRMSPDVILEVDHIKPVAEGGTNKMLNLITSCRDCNRGKGKIRLSDDTELKKQQKELQELADKREQLKMMMEWRMELSNLEEEEIDHISDYLYSKTGHSLAQPGRVQAMGLLKQFGFNEVLDAIDIAIAQYYKGDIKSCAKAWEKVGGICYNRRKKKEEEQNGDTQEHTDVVLDGHEDM